MGQRHEIHFIAARREVHASIDSVMKYPRKFRRVIGRNLFDAPNRRAALCVQPENRSRARYLKRQRLLGKLSV